MSVPAEIRRRWATSTVIAEDHGDHLIVRPAPDDPITAAHGALAAELSVGPAIAEIREAFRREEAEIEERKAGPYRHEPHGGSRDA